MFNYFSWLVSRVQMQRLTKFTETDCTAIDSEGVSETAVV
jgi:hypothetical protein